MILLLDKKMFFIANGDFVLVHGLLDGPQIDSNVTFD